MMSTSGGRSVIGRVPKSGGSVEVLASSDDVGGIVVTDTNVYWLNYSRAVLKLDKP
jgi:hypothetical protein